MTRDFVMEDPRSTVGYDVNSGHFVSAQLRHYFAQHRFVVFGSLAAIPKVDEGPAVRGSFLKNANRGGMEFPRQSRVLVPEEGGGLFAINGRDSFDHVLELVLRRHKR